MISQHWFNWWIVASYMTLNGVTRIQLVDCQNLNASAYAACVKWLYSKVCNQNFAFNALLLRMTTLWWKHSTLLMIWYVQYIPRNMHTVFALLCFVVVIHWLIFPYPSGLLHWHCGNLTIAPVPAKQPWWIWINTSCEFIMNDRITTTKQSTTKPCAYFLGYTVCRRSCDWSYLQYELHICESCVSGVLSSTARVSVTHTQFKLCHGPTSTTSTEGAVFSSDSRNPSWRPIVNSQWLLILWRHKELWYPIMNSATCCWDCVYCVILNMSKQRVIWFVTTKCDDILIFYSCYY